VLVGYESESKRWMPSALLRAKRRCGSTGNRNSPIELPEAERVVGAYEEIQILNYPGAPVVPARGRSNSMPGYDRWWG
jgi:hypothetical protein